MDAVEFDGQTLKDTAAGLATLFSVVQSRVGRWASAVAGGNGQVRRAPLLSKEAWPVHTEMEGTERQRRRADQRPTMPGHPSAADPSAQPARYTAMRGTRQTFDLCNDLLYVGDRINLHAPHFVGWSPRVFDHAVQSEGILDIIPNVVGVPEHIEDRAALRPAPTEGDPYHSSAHRRYPRSWPSRARSGGAVACEHCSLSSEGGPSGREKVAPLPQQRAPTS